MAELWSGDSKVQDLNSLRIVWSSIRLFSSQSKLDFIWNMFAEKGKKIQKPHKARRMGLFSEWCFGPVTKNFIKKPSKRKTNFELDEGSHVKLWKRHQITYVLAEGKEKKNI